MKSKDVKSFLRYYLYGTLVSSSIFIVYWLTGWRKWSQSEAYSISELITSILEPPFLILGSIFFGGLIIAIGLFLYVEKGWEI